MYCGHITVTVGHLCELIYYKSILTVADFLAIKPQPQKGQWVREPYRFFFFCLLTGCTIQIITVAFEPSCDVQGCVNVQ